jgi:NAD(P)H-dependent FMN reductase/transposase-like protein
VLLRHYLEQGLTKTELAQKLGLHRRTIYHWIQTGQLDQELDDELVRYTPRPAVAKKLDPYCGIIQSRLEEFPRLSAKRLFREIRRALHGWLHAAEGASAPRPAGTTARAAHTPRDRSWPSGASGLRLVHVAVGSAPCAARRAGLLAPLVDALLCAQTMQTLFRGLEAALGFFRGVPAELLFDQMSAVITDDRRNDGGTLVENAEFLRFAHHHGFKVRACRPYRAKTKGKVERRKIYCLPVVPTIAAASVPEARSAKFPLQARGTGLALEVSVFQPLIGIVTTSTREHRFGEKAAQWIHRIAVQRNDLRFEIVDLRDYELPFFDGVSSLWAPVENPAAIRWAKKMAELDGYLFVTAEYNHSVTGVFKNALDWAYREYNRKPAAHLGYGALGAGRAVEQLRLINKRSAPNPSANR